jgi:hypothetical protein
MVGGFMDEGAGRKGTRRWRKKTRWSRSSMRQGGVEGSAIADEWTLACSTSETASERWPAQGCDV